jgi:transcription elongation factor GreA
MVNAIQKIPITAQGLEKLREELQHLKTVARPMVIKAISDARSNGDLKENADYHAAREQQAFIEGRILDLENKLSNCQVIDIKKISNDGKIIFGTTVTLLSVDDKLTKEVVYQIVGDDEADLKLGKLSVNSPLAKALIGKYEGDEVNVNAPSGIVTYEVMKVEYI